MLNKNKLNIAKNGYVYLIKYQFFKKLVHQ